MKNEDYNFFPLPLFTVSIKNGKILTANSLAHENGIHINADFFDMLEEKALFSKLVKYSHSPFRQEAKLNINNIHYYAHIHANEINDDGEASLLLLLSKLEPVSLLSEQEVIENVINGYKNNIKNPLFNFLLLTAQNVGAFNASLYEKKNGRFSLCDEWRGRKCVCVPLLSEDYERNMSTEIKRLRSLKRAEDVMCVPYQKKYGTQGLVIYFFEKRAHELLRQRISNYIDVYKVLAPDKPKSVLSAVEKGLECVEQSIGIWDAETNELLYHNKAFREKFGKGSTQLLIKRFPKDYKPGEGPNLVYSDSKGRCFSMSHKKTRHGKRNLITTVVCDITRYKKAESRLQMLARTDALTGLNNRRAGLEMLDNAYSQCKQRGEPLTVCFADIDGLKKINDTYGHGVGDNMIRTVAGILRKQLDGVGHVCRLGGDEFVLIMPGCKKDEAMLLTLQIEKAVNRSFLNNSDGISISFGFKEAEYSEGETSSTLLSIADFNMYKEKQKKA